MKWSTEDEYFPDNAGIERTIIEVDGYVRKIFYFNVKNNFTVFGITLRSGEKMNAYGKIPLSMQPTEKRIIYLRGSVFNHPKYGNGLRVYSIGTKPLGKTEDVKNLPKSKQCISCKRKYIIEKDLNNTRRCVACRKQFC